MIDSVDARDGEIPDPSIPGRTPRNGNDYNARPSSRDGALRSSDIKVRTNDGALQDLSARLTEHLPLLLHLTWREFGERYAGQVGGIAWAIAHPIFLMLVYLVVFGHVFKVSLQGPPGTGTYTVYLLSALIPWLAAVEVLGRAPSTILANPGFVRQMLFPVEVLPARTVASTLPMQLVATLVLFIYIVSGHGQINIYWILWPFATLLSCVALMGFSYACAAISVYFRDLKDIVVLLTTAGFFISPICYTAEMLPPPIRFIPYLNPFSYVIWVQQDIFYYGRIEHPSAWIVLALASLVVLHGGYGIFRRLRPWFGEFV